MNRLLLFLLTFSLLFFFSCTSNEIGNAKDVNPEAIYFDYRIWGEEGNDQVTVKLQYRFGGPNGTTLLLEEPGKVELDGQVLKADSSSYSGVYYEVQKPVASFTGRHTIVFTDINKKEYKEIFTFRPIALETEIPDTIQRSRIVFKFRGIDGPDYIRVLMTDTSFTGEGINRLDTVYRDGLIKIKKEEMAELANGPIQLELIREFDKPVRNGTSEGGRVSITYTLRREFFLKD
ncbi:MAG TPA: hypothetical protein VN451_04420 [Chitinophagaceae bacterium]|nr:hypothetical protein [Chitinophagaceae bacterium]